MKSEIQQKLENLAYKRTNPFCYHCYKVAPSGRCTSCMSDDLMQELEGVGVEYGVDWVIKHILETELTPADLEEAFEESIRQSYPEETKVGWMTFDTVSLMKSQDPISWDCAFSEYQSNEEAEENIISLCGSNYFWTHEVEKILHQE